MIVYKNKGFEQRTDKPNENWTNEDCYVVEDGTELANKIIQAYPFYNFITDENDDLIDIVPKEKPTIEGIPREPTLDEEVEELKQLVADLASLQLGV